MPNLTAYAETCAAIGNVFWNYRMFLLHGESKYMDVLERTLYNGLISGVGLDGKSFFYTNTLEVKNNFTHPDLETGRSGWFTCSCCPTNITRLIPSVPGYIYARKDNNIYVNLYISSSASLEFNKKNSVFLTQQSNYPWDGHIRITLQPGSPVNFNLLLRIPGWARNEATPGGLYQFQNSVDSPIVIMINGQDCNYRKEKGYAVLNRKWKAGDIIELRLPMDVKKI